MTLQLSLFDPTPPASQPGASQDAQAHVHDERAIREARERGSLSYVCACGGTHFVPPPLPEPADGVPRNAYGFELTATVYGPGEPVPPPPAPGDRVRFAPFTDRRRLVSTEGVLVEEIQGSSGGVGYHIMSPLPDDPGRLVRVWLSDGFVTVVSRASDPDRAPDSPPARHSAAP